MPRKRFSYRFIEAPNEQNMKKGLTRFMLVDEDENDDVPKAVTRVILRNVFEAPKDKTEQRAFKFPETFITKIKMAIKYELNGEKYSA